MSVAEPFTALGAGNGFPFCLASEYGSDVDYELSNMSLNDAMRLYWSLESIAFGLNISFEYEYRSTSAGSDYENHSYSSVISEVMFDYREYDASGDVSYVNNPPPPKERTCVPLRVGRMGSSTPTIQYHPNGDDRIAMYYDLSFGINDFTRRRWVKNSGMYSFGQLSGWWVFFGHGSAAVGSTTGARFAAVTTSPEPPTSGYVLTDQKQYNIPFADPITAYLYTSSKERPFTLSSYISHSWASVGETFNFYTYP